MQQVSGDPSHLSMGGALGFSQKADGSEDSDVRFDLTETQERGWTASVPV